MDCSSSLSNPEFLFENDDDLFAVMQMATALTFDSDEVAYQDSLPTATNWDGTEASAVTPVNSNRNLLEENVTTVSNSKPISTPEVNLRMNATLFNSTETSGTMPNNSTRNSSEGNLVKTFRPKHINSPTHPPTYIPPLTPPKTPKAEVRGATAKIISTLVFFDLETTGLAHEIGKSNVQITELSMIAINRREYEESTSNELKDIRIINKLCMCFKPRVMISQGAAKITGLNNYNLIDEHPFDHTAANTVISFLAHLPEPVCLLAHNGTHFDYPILKAELKRLSTQLPVDIFIADTLKAFRALCIPEFPLSKEDYPSVKIKNGKISYALDNLHIYFFNKKPIGSHSSEGDCITLAKICHVMKDVILSWIDENCTGMDSVKPMW